MSSKPLLLYDGDCTFCIHWVNRWRTLTDDAVRYEPYQERPRTGTAGKLKDSELSRAIHLVDGDSVYRGAAAVLQILQLSPSYWAAGLAGEGLYRHFPPFRWAIDLGYRIVAANRGPAAWVNWILEGDPRGPIGHQRVRWAFFRGLGLTFLTAFASLGLQVHGLMGSRGIVPATWSDGMLTTFSLGGVLASIALTADLAPPIALGACWLLYRLLTSAGDVFFAFQWDALLLEAGLTSLLFVAWRGLPSKPSREPLASVIGLWWLRLLAFRVVFFSGWAKIASGDVSWRDGTALRYHFETQPLPTPVGVFFHQLPPGLLDAMTWGLLVTELLVPWTLFMGRRARAWGACVLLSLLAMITLTGNYGFFTLLTGVLLLTWFDDGFLTHGNKSKPEKARWPGLLRGAAVAVLGLACVVPPLQPLARGLSVSQPYGVFAVMTRVRREVAVEGTQDGKTWLEYSFKYKPQDLTKAPSFLPFHMPRLDWQMWFAPLGGLDGNPWFGHFVLRLLDASPAVLGLLSEAPFKEAPFQVRSRIAEYDLASPETRAKTGEWWARRASQTFVVPYELKKSAPGR